jgi:sporulation protein YlmC with PRC-barrel domain
MLYRMEKLIGMTIGASDGEIGKIKDVYFDDHRWAARYLVVDTGGWLEQRKVLISPFSVNRIDWDLRVVHVNLSRERVKRSPGIDTDKPVSRQHEIEFFGYYGYPGYWGGPLLWGAMPYPVLPAAVADLPVNEALPGHSEAPIDSHLHSAAEVTGYHIHATDVSIGHVEDFTIDSESWAIRYMVIDTRNWWPGKHVVIPPQWIKRLDWPERLVYVAVDGDTVQNAPEYDPSLEFSREHETKLYRYYRQPGYWE